MTTTTKHETAAKIHERARDEAIKTAERPTIGGKAVSLSFSKTALQLTKEALETEGRAERQGNNELECSEAALLACQQEHFNASAHWHNEAARVHRKSIPAEPSQTCASLEVGDILDMCAKDSVPILISEAGVDKAYGCTNAALFDLVDDDVDGVLVGPTTVALLSFDRGAHLPISTTDLRPIPSEPIVTERQLAWQAILEDCIQPLFDSDDDEMPPNEREELKNHVAKIQETMDSMDAAERRYRR